MNTICLLAAITYGATAPAVRQGPNLTRSNSVTVLGETNAQGRAKIGEGTYKRLVDMVGIKPRTSLWRVLLVTPSLVKPTDLRFESAAKEKIPNGSLVFFSRQAAYGRSIIALGGYSASIINDNKPFTLATTPPALFPDPKGPSGDYVALAIDGFFRHSIKATLQPFVSGGSQAQPAPKMSAGSLCIVLKPNEMLGSPPKPINLGAYGTAREPIKIVARTTDSVTVIGEVNKPGVYKYVKGQTFADYVLKDAGGLTDWAGTSFYLDQPKLARPKVLGPHQDKPSPEPGSVICVTRADVPNGALFIDLRSALADSEASGPVPGSEAGPTQSTVAPNAGRPPIPPRKTPLLQWKPFATSPALDALTKTVLTGVSGGDDDKAGRAVTSSLKVNDVWASEVPDELVLILRDCHLEKRTVKLLAPVQWDTPVGPGDLVLRLPQSYARKLLRDGLDSPAARELKSGLENTKVGVER